jgi:fructose-1,6-bisphosphatase/inositol monophosphatase family enzyme
VTDVDLEISRRFKSFCQNNFSDLDYLIVDEESIAAVKFDDLKKHDYVFVLDPIDGSLTYSVGLPDYGVMAAVYQDGSPMLAFLNCPGLDLLAARDGSEIWLTAGGKKSKLIPMAEAAPLFDGSFDPADVGNLDLFAPYSSAVSGIYLATGQLCGKLFPAKWWDLAVPLAIASGCGVRCFDPATGEAVDLFDRKWWDDKWHVKSCKIICRPKYYDELKKVFRQAIEHGWR